MPIQRRTYGRHPNSDNDTTVTELFQNNSTMSQLNKIEPT